MRARSKNALRAAVAAVGVVVAACSSVEPPAQRAALPPPPAAEPAPGPRYGSFEQYEVVLAQHIFDANAGMTITGQLQPLLRAIVVLHFDIDASGRARNVRTWRSPDPAADFIARESLRRAGPLPAPPRSWLRDGSLGITETWLFNSDGRFHLRALGPTQS